MSSVVSGRDYVAGSDKSDSVDLEHQARLRVYVPDTAGANVVMRVATDHGDMTLTFPPGFNDWEPVWVQRIYSTGTSGDVQAGVVINLGLR